MDLVVNTIFNFDLQMYNNNCSSLGFGMKRSKNDMLRILDESTTRFVWPLGVFAQSLELWAYLIEN